MVLDIKQREILELLNRKTVSGTELIHACFVLTPLWVSTYGSCWRTVTRQALWFDQSCSGIPWSQTKKTKPNSSHFCRTTRRSNAFSVYVAVWVNITFLLTFYITAWSHTALVISFFQYFYCICSCHKIPYSDTQLLFISLRRAFQVALYKPKPWTICLSAFRTCL